MGKDKSGANGENIIIKVPPGTEIYNENRSVLLADLLENNGITVNKNGVPNDPRSFVETSGIRIGTAAETTRGHDKQWFNNLANNITNILNN